MTEVYIKPKDDYRNISFTYLLIFIYHSLLNRRTSNRRQCRKSAYWFVWPSSWCWWLQPAWHGPQWIKLGSWKLSIISSTSVIFLLILNVHLVVLCVVILVVAFILIVNKPGMLYQYNASMITHRENVGDVLFICTFFFEIILSSTLWD